MFCAKLASGNTARTNRDTDKARKRANEQRRQRLMRQQRRVDRINLAPGSELRQVNDISYAVTYAVTPEGNELITQKRQLSTKESRQRNQTNQTV